MTRIVGLAIAASSGACAPEPPVARAVVSAPVAAPIDPSLPKLVVQRVDDAIDPLPRVPAEDDDWPVGMMLEAEATGADHHVVHYLRLPVAEGASMQGALDKLRVYVARIRLAQGREMGFSRVHDEAGKDVGWRTVVLVSKVALTPRNVRAAKQTEQGLLISLDDVGRAALATLTHDAAGERLALSIGTEVVALPVVKAPIESGELLVPAR